MTILIPTQKRVLQLFTLFLFLSNILLLSCSENSSKQEETAPKEPVDKLTLTNGLNPINKTRDHTLFAKVKAGKVVGWEVQNKEGEPVEITFKKEEKAGSGKFKCLACIQKEDLDGQTVTKCWEIPCESMPLPSENKAVK